MNLLKCIISQINRFFNCFYPILSSIFNILVQELCRYASYILCRQNDSHELCRQYFPLAYIELVFYYGV